MGITMDKEQKAYAKKIEDLRIYIRQTKEILHKLIKDCKHLIVCMEDFGGAYCDICGESFGWYCEKSPVKYCEFVEESGWINCKHCEEPKERK